MSQIEEYGRKLQYKGNNPGAVLHGNFINYYQFHPPENRIKCLPKGILRNAFNNKTKIYAFDIGCNTGNLTRSLFEFLSEEFQNSKPSVIGVDIDPVLIKRAKENNDNNNVSFHCLDIMNTHQREAFIKECFKENNIKEFDIIFCLSMTMWIHLNHGDDGLKNFLNYLSNLSKIIVIEAQPWKCYKTAVKRLKLCNEQFPMFEKLKIKESIEEEIENILQKECKLQKVFESDRTNWGRRIVFFRR